MQIIPAIDIIDGKCVRLTQGDFEQKKVYNENPLVVAMNFEDIGIKRLHLVDLDGAKTGRVVNYKVLEGISTSTNLTIDFGGGIKTDKDIQKVFDSGADIATIGSVAVNNKKLFHSWLDKYGKDKILLGADVRHNKIAISGWFENTSYFINDFIEENIQNGVKNIFCTDITKDGLMLGPAFDLYKSILEKYPNLNLIASGGISSINDLFKLQEIGCSGAIIGKAIYEGLISYNDLKLFLINAD
ncbi:MAG: 1-(5-phosphoribosyl)-5-[(5-phosphoribosylamino)methylideneamino]imidazole-4-carboxamide isomerase [FCB group bacterium]|jgi:phosphoribosylformimino-5-aminoimidazole carboxamide ribotide isomerase